MFSLPCSVRMRIDCSILPRRRMPDGKPLPPCLHPERSLNVPRPLLSSPLMSTNGNNGNGGIPAKFLWWLIASFFGPMVLALVGMQLHTTLDSVQRIGVLEAQDQELFRQGQEINRKPDRLIERTRPSIPQPRP